MLKCQLCLKYIKFQHAKKSELISQDVFNMKYELFPEVVQICPLHLFLLLTK